MLSWAQLIPCFFSFIFFIFFFSIFQHLLRPAPHFCPPDYCALAKVANRSLLADWLLFVSVLLPTQSALTSPPVSEAAVGTADVVSVHSQHDEGLCYTATFGTKAK